MVERNRITIREVDLKNGSTDIKTRDIELNHNASDDTSKFLFNIGQQMRRGIYYYSVEGRKGSGGRLRNKRELRDIKKHYPSLEDMQEIVSSLNGISDKRFVVYRKDNKVIGFKLEELEKQNSD